MNDERFTALDWNILEGGDGTIDLSDLELDEVESDDDSNS